MSTITRMRTSVLFWHVTLTLAIGLFQPKMQAWLTEVRTPCRRESRIPAPPTGRMDARGGPELDCSFLELDNGPYRRGARDDTRCRPQVVFPLISPANKFSSVSWPLFLGGHRLNTRFGSANHL